MGWGCRTHPLRRSLASLSPGRSIVHVAVASVRCEMEAQNPSEMVDGRPYGHHDPSRPPARLPHPPAGEPDAGGDEIDPSRQAGIHAIEMYVPRHAVKASTLEKAHGVDGKYTSGLMMSEFCGTGEDEDPVSIATVSAATQAI